MKKITILLVFLFLIIGIYSISKVKKGQVLYVGGTITDLPENTIGKLITRDPQKLLFTSSEGDFNIIYKKITSIEYGQKAGRRVGVSLVISPWVLFSKKRKHYITIGFKDEKGNSQGVVLEVPKGKAKTMITILEVRSGKKCEYESKEAKEHVFG